jgi:hypothetical protein
MWVQNPGSSPQSSLTILSNTLHRIKYSLSIKRDIKLNNYAHQFPRKTVNVAHTKFKYEISHGLKLNLAHISSHQENKCGLFRITVAHTNRNIYYNFHIAAYYAHHTGPATVFIVHTNSLG